MHRSHVLGTVRRFGALAAVLALTVSGSYATWAVQSVPPDQGVPILVDITLTTWTLRNSPGRPPWTDVSTQSTVYQVQSGAAAPYGPAHPVDFRCTAILPKAGATATPADSGAPVIPAPVGAQILLRCKISRNGDVISSPSLIAVDGQAVTLKFDEDGGTIRYQLQIMASASPDRNRIDAAYSKARIPAPDPSSGAQR